MEMPKATWRVNYAPGEWLTLAGPTMLVVLPPAGATAEQVETLWRQMLEAGSADALVQLVSAAGLDGLSHLGAFFWDDEGVRALTRGLVRLVDANTSQVMIDGSGALTWREAALGTQRQLRLDLGASPTPTELRLPLLIGAARVSEVYLSTTEADRVQFQAAAPQAQASHAASHSPSESAPIPYQASVVESYQAPAAEPYQSPVPAPVPPAPAQVAPIPVETAAEQVAPIPVQQPAPEFSPSAGESPRDETLLFGQEEALEASDNALAEVSQPSQEPWNSSVPDVAVPPPPAAAASYSTAPPASLTEASATQGPSPLTATQPEEIPALRDDQTVFSSSLAAAHKPASPNEPVVPQVLAVPCTNNHANAPGALNCRICQAPVDSSNARLIRRPVLAGVHTNKGDFADIINGIVVGRAPDQNSGPVGCFLMRVVSPSNDISRNHVLITTKDWGVQVTDLHSTNGTTVLPPGEAPFTIRDGSCVQVEIGTVLDLGDGVSLRIEPPRS